MEVVEKALHDAAVDSDRIHIERFTPLPMAVDLPAPLVSDQAAGTRVTITLGGRTKTVTQTAQWTILQLARSSGLPAQSSCESGHCATCMAQVVEGRVAMRVNDVLTPDEIAEGWVLTCQAVPVPDVFASSTTREQEYDDDQLPATARRHLDGALSRTRHRPVSFEDSVSAEFYELERDAIFRRAWLNVGRVDDLPRSGSWFTKDLVAARTSMLVVRGMDGDGPRVPQRVPPPGQQARVDRTPRQEAAGVGRQFACKYHGWRYGLDGGCTYVHQENEFFGIDKADLGSRAGALRGVGRVHLRQPRRRRRAQSLREYLGPMVGALEDYPFDLMTERYSFRAENASNWKVFIDAFQEYYHVPPLHTHQLGPVHRNPEATFEGAHYQLDGPHRVVSTSGSAEAPLPGRVPLPERGADAQRQHRPVGRARARRGRCAGVNPGGVEALGDRQLPDLPEPGDPRLRAQLVPELPVLADIAQHARVRGGPVVRARRRPRASGSHASTRRSRSRSTRCRTPARSTARSSVSSRGRSPTIPLNDQEILVRHFHKTVADWVDEHEQRGGEARRR